MSTVQTPLPDQPSKLKSIINELILQKEDLAHVIKVEQSHNNILKEQIKLLKDRLFGKKSEVLSKLEIEQGDLFNEAEAEASEAEQPVLGEIKVPAYTRKKPGRKPLPDDLPREEIIHDLTEEEKHCCHCHKALPAMGADTSEELTIIPEQVKVIRHIRKKYGACDCDGTYQEENHGVKVAAMPARMIPGSIVSPSLLAYTITAKYQDGLPFYRQSKQFERRGIDLPRATLCNWALKAVEKCLPILDLLNDEIKSSPLLQTDETKVQVLKEPGRLATTQSYMWVRRGIVQKHPIVIYHYSPDRSKETAKALLAGYQGYLQTDDYAGYDEVGKQDGIIHVGCFAHARRKFIEAQKVNDRKPGLYDEALRYIRELYKIEKLFREKLTNHEWTSEEFVRKRKERAGPILSAYHRWLKKQKKVVLPSCKLGQAIAYNLNNWEKLKRYLDAACLTPDNNLVENAIRPFVIGRRNWLFSNTPRGADASACLYSIVETAKANGLEPFHYLNYLFTHLPAAKCSNDIKVLLPTQVTPEMIKALAVS
jgi:transposase